MKNLKWPLILLTLTFSVSAFTKPAVKKINKRMTACTLEDLATAGLGDVKYSILSETQFQNVNGTGWVLMKNQTKTDLGISGTTASVFDYLTTTDNYSISNLPDSRGQFLRGRNNATYPTGGQDPDGIRSIGNPQDDMFKAHTHSTSASTQVGPGNAMVATGGSNSVPSISGATGGSETRPKNIAINIFVKVKRNCIDASVASLITANTTSITALQDYNSQNQCDVCLTMPEGTLSDLQSKVACFSNEIDLYEGDQKHWSVTCTARTVGYTKKVLMLIGINRTSEDNELLSHLDNQYPYYNVISVN